MDLGPWLVESKEGQGKVSDIRGSRLNKRLYMSCVWWCVGARLNVDLTVS